MRIQNKGFTCSVEDCENSAICRGYCSNHYKRWRLYGDPLHMKPRFVVEKACKKCGVVKPRSENATPSWGTLTTIQIFSDGRSLIWKGTNEKILREPVTNRNELPDAVQVQVH